jgi:tRNA A-37 threonylcarbamoyl transferase component Bud32
MAHFETIDTKCFPVSMSDRKQGSERKDCIWRLREEIPMGEKSMYASVFLACCNDDCKYVMKVMTRKDTTNPKDDTAAIMIQREATIQNYCSQWKLCKPVVDWWLCDDRSGGVIITELLQQTLKRRIQQVDDETKKAMIHEAIVMIDILHIKGVIHGDTHLDNFMVDEYDNIFFIDMGLSKQTNELKGVGKDDAIMDDYIRLATSLLHIDSDINGNEESVYADMYRDMQFAIQTAQVSGDETKIIKFLVF